MLVLHAITKRFGDRLALDAVDLALPPGRLTGFVGGNGAGKTTAMRIALGVLAADSGVVELDGVPVTERDRRRFGYMPEERGLYPKMKVLPHIAYLARLHGDDRRSALRRAADLLEMLGLSERAGDPVESLSLGNQQRAQIAAALVHRPSVIILDEPFSGLDPIAVDSVASILADHAAAGAAVLFSSHQLELVERLCDDLVIIADGRIRAAGARDALRDRFAGSRYEVEAAADLGWLHGQSGITAVELAGNRASFEAPDPGDADRVLREALVHGRVTLFRPLRPTLSDIFKEVVR